MTGGPYRIGKIVSVLPSGVREQIAMRLFGWRWLACIGTPTRGTPGYPQERRVRQFFPPLESRSPEGQKRWKEYFDRVPHEPANGDEALSYRYCSSMGPDYVPDYGGDCGETMAAVREMQERHGLTYQTRKIGRRWWGASFHHGDEVLSAVKAQDQALAAAAAILDALDVIEGKAKPVVAVETAQ